MARATNWSGQARQVESLVVSARQEQLVISALEQAISKYREVWQYLSMAGMAISKYGTCY